MTLLTLSSREEGGERYWSLLAKEFVNYDRGNVSHIKLVDIKWDEKQKMQEIEGTERLIPFELALLAIGFKQPENSLLESLGVDQTAAGTVKSDSYQTSNPQVFVSGDARRGQSIVVSAISESREAALELDLYLMGKTDLP
jgi:glutamate synthase (NADPH/NADH) small chain